MGACIIFIIGVIIQTASINRGMLITGRFIAGLGVGTLSMVVPVYQSEQWAITWGILIAFWIDYGCHFIKSNASWRVPIAIQMVPANDPAVIEEFEDIKEVRLERETVVRSYTELAKYPIRRPAHGINVIMYFAPSIFKQYQRCHNMLATIPAILWVDRWGRRKTLMIGSFMCGATYFIQAGVSYLVIVMVYLFVISFAASWGPVGWIYPAEIFPMHIRSRASSIATASNWLFNFVVGLVAPILIKKITWGLDLIFAIEMEVIFTGSIWAHKDAARIAQYDSGRKEKSDDV
ncbi:MFS general substrate transporter [Linderina pennispora]|uniref:MFS general substrate transporter n=1 Tax=Linderina pennispora TaxID=61395 RepID=A0A1Y1VUS3_9FUNG|nr:MFS general substrate transporter [Linderina pennispora]ORX65027.1 MFS general substrate transporter [Linderina pennispora]